MNTDKEKEKHQRALERFRLSMEDFAKQSEQTAANLLAYIEQLKRAGNELRNSAEMLGYVQSSDDYRKAVARVVTWDRLVADAPNTDRIVSSLGTLKLDRPEHMCQVCNRNTSGTARIIVRRNGQSIATVHAHCAVGMRWDDDVDAEPEPTSHD